MLNQIVVKWMGFMNSERQAAWTNLGLLLLRLAFGGFMAFGHGLGKLTHFGEKSEVFELFGLGSSVTLALAAFAEFFCSIALMLGLATRLVLIPLMVTMVEHRGGNKQTVRRLRNHLCRSTSRA